MGFTILVDVDEVCAGLIESWIARYNQEAGDSLNHLDVDTWGLRGHVYDDWADKVYDLLRNPTLYDEVKPLPGALQGVNRLRYAGHEVYFITSTETPGRKLEWLKKHYFLPDNRDAKRYYLEVDSESKWLVHGDVMIDDRPETVQAFVGDGILFSSPHNRNSKYPMRANNWEEATGIVANLYAIHEQAENAIAPEQQVANMLAGVGPNTPTTINALGGRQSHLPYRFDLMDPIPLFRVSAILGEGAAKYGEWNWRNITVNDNLNHALSHIYAHLAGDTQDDHLGHALCRLMFAASRHSNPDPLGLMPPTEPKK